ncbi:MAG: sulfatase [Bacteroides sp. SM23_62_1]|nr:MAG: sulfatase [Bacteroides sp. SM23_62_1]
MKIYKHEFCLWTIAQVVIPLLFLLPGCRSEKQTPPNILMLMSDNQSWNHMGCYGDPVVRTPNIDQVASQGIRFTHAFCAAPSCTPARAALLSGQDIWRLKEGANLWGIFPAKFPVYTDLLEESGYFVGYQGKGWGPGSVQESGRERNPAGNEYQSFEEFIATNTANKPWCFWYSSEDPHRPYNVGSGVSSGMDINNVMVPPYLPDNDTVRGDICDYYYEIERFDKSVGEILRKLDETGQYENTLIVICSDNGWQMPRGLANVYDFGTRIPLIISWNGKIPGARVIEDFISLSDLAPTYLELAGLDIPDFMTAKSLADLLFAEKSGRIDEQRDYIITARERHALCRYNGLGYPCRAIRTYDFLYIRNYEPDRWPAGDPPLFGDIDAHMLHYPSPTKMYMLVNKDKPEVKPLFEHAMLKRPAEELFDLKNDPWQMNNIADHTEYQAIKKELSEKLYQYLESTSDPRILGRQIIWDSTAYFAEDDFNPRPSEEAIRLLKLEKEYRYFD